MKRSLARLTMQPCGEGLEPCQTAPFFYRLEGAISVCPQIIRLLRMIDIWLFHLTAELGFDSPPIWQGKRSAGSQERVAGMMWTRFIRTQGLSSTQENDSFVL